MKMPRRCPQVCRSERRCGKSCSARLDIERLATRVNVKRLASAGIFSIFRRSEIAREIAVRLTLLQIRA